MMGSIIIEVVAIPWANVRGMSIIVSNSWALLWMNLWEMAVTGEEGRALGYQVSSLPKAGRAISFQPGVAGADNQYGHVAFVEAVTSDGIIISESNVINDQTISYRVLPNVIAYSSGVTYIGA